MGKSTISMAIFNSYVKLPEGSIADVGGWTGWTSINPSYGMGFLQKYCGFSMRHSRRFSMRDDLGGGQQGSSSVPSVGWPRFGERRGVNYEDFLPYGIPQYLPSGKHTKKLWKNPHFFNGKTHYFYGHFQ